MDKKKLTERDICTKYILPALKKAGWNVMTQIREEVPLRDGKVVVRGNVAARKTVKAADIVLYTKYSQPIAVIEAKANKFEIGKGMQQAMGYAKLLDVPFVFASNGDGFVFRNEIAKDNEQLEQEIALDDFPSPDELQSRLIESKGLNQNQAEIVTQDYYSDGSDKSPRYYQIQAISKTIEAIVKGQNRILLVMATGTGKTYTAFQIIWRLWKARHKKRILFLADRNALIDQTFLDDFQPFGTAMTKVKGRKFDPSYEIHLALYQAITGPEEHQKAFKQISPDFFDLIVIDECHRGSAADDSAWREILEYFQPATQIGLTATPKETDDVSNTDYFNEPIYTYSLKEGIEDGFLAPYKVVRVDIDVDLQGWRPTKGQVDNSGELIEDRIYNQKDFDRTMVIDERTELVAKTITGFLQKTNPMDKTIVFCNDIDHADRMRRALINLNPEQVKKNDKYIMKITGDDQEGKAQLDSFTNPKKPYPVIVTTSELLTTGVNAKTCKLIVLDQNIQSMTKFKQIIGRGTRIDEKFNKLWFTILDFKKATELFADPRFDGIPEKVMVKEPDQIIDPDDDNFEDEFNDPTISNDAEDNEINAPETEYNGSLDPFDPEEPEKIKKYRVSGVDVKKVAERVQYYDENGKLVTESFRDYTKKTVQKQFASLDDFIKSWTQAERKETIIQELEKEGVIWQALREDVGKEFDPFDLICHVVFDQPPLTRQERINNVKKRNYFTKYSEQAQNVLNILLDKYADVGLSEMENIRIFKTSPLNELGSTKEIITNIFGSKKEYYKALADLEQALYLNTN
ncbi:MAG: EcoAI/FtnUII family type I restriction enzme subunit R [Marinicella pacifica]